MDFLKLSGLILIVLAMVAFVLFISRVSGPIDVSDPRILMDKEGRLKKKFLPYAIIALVLGIILFFIGRF